MSVHYKFKSALEYDTVTFDGLHISVKDLKRAILRQKRIGKTSDFDLQVTNAQTKETYSDENVLIPKNASLIVARVPLTQQQLKQWDKEKQSANAKPGENSEQNTLSQVDISSLDLSEEEKIKTMITQSTSDYDPSNYIKVRGGNQVGTVPTSYICFKCHQHGHWIKDCPSSLDSSSMCTPDTVKKSTGIPRSFMIQVEGPQVPGARITPSGIYAVPAIDHEVYNGKKIEKPPFLAEKEKPAPTPTIPEDLICGICKDLLQDAVMIPCCGISFCDECIRTVLVDSEESECPDCNEKNVSPDTMIPNRFLRNSVNTFKNKTGYVKAKGQLIQQRLPSPPRPSLPDFVPPPDYVESTTAKDNQTAAKADKSPILVGSPSSLQIHHSPFQSQTTPIYSEKSPFGENSNSSHPDHDTISSLPHTQTNSFPSYQYHGGSGHHPFYQRPDQLIRSPHPSYGPPGPGMNSQYPNYSRPPPNFVGPFPDSQSGYYNRHRYPGYEDGEQKNVEGKDSQRESGLGIDDDKKEDGTKTDLKSQGNDGKENFGKSEKDMSKLEKLKKAGLDIDDVSSVSSNASEEPPPPVENRRPNEGHHDPSQGPSYAIPSLFSGQNPVILPPPNTDIYSSVRQVDHFSPCGDRSSTPTVDERLEIRPAYEPFRPSNYMGPGYDQHSYGMSHPASIPYDPGMTYDRGYRGMPRGPRMHRGRYIMRQPPPPGSRPLSPPRNEEEAYLAFQRMLKEKEERDKRKNEKLKSRRSTSRSRSRSATRSRRSFSGARSRSRSRSRTPPRRSRSKKRSRTRSRSFVITRSRSRSYSRSPLHERNYSPRKYSSPNRSPLRCERYDPGYGQWTQDPRDRWGRYRGRGRGRFYKTSPPRGHEHQPYNRYRDENYVSTSPRHYRSPSRYYDQRMSPRCSDYPKESRERDFRSYERESESAARDRDRNIRRRSHSNSIVRNHYESERERDRIRDRDRERERDRDRDRERDRDRDRERERDRDRENDYRQRSRSRRMFTPPRRLSQERTDRSKDKYPERRKDWDRDKDRRHISSDRNGDADKEKRKYSGERDRNKDMDVENKRRERSLSRSRDKSRREKERSRSADKKHESPGREKQKVSEWTNRRRKSGSRHRSISRGKGEQRSRSAEKRPSKAMHKKKSESPEKEKHKTSPVRKQGEEAPVKSPPREKTRDQSKPFSPKVADKDDDDKKEKKRDREKKKKKKEKETDAERAARKKKKKDKKEEKKRKLDWKSSDPIAKTPSGDENQCEQSKVSSDLNTSENLIARLKPTTNGDSKSSPPGNSLASSKQEYGEATEQNSKPDSGNDGAEKGDGDNSGIVHRKLYDNSDEVEGDTSLGDENIELQLHASDESLLDESEDNQKEGILATMPEISKWELEESQVSDVHQKGDLTDAKSPEFPVKVTREVIKRAENAIFEKALNAIREPTKKVFVSEKEEKKERKLTEVKDRGKKQKSDQEYDKSKRIFLSREKDKYHRSGVEVAKSKSEIKRTVNSLQITIPLHNAGDSPMREFSVDDDSEKDRIQRKEKTSKSPPPGRVPIKERLGSKVEKQGRHSVPQVFRTMEKNTRNDSDDERGKSSRKDFLRSTLSSTVESIDGKRSSIDEAHFIPNYDVSSAEEEMIKIQISQEKESKTRSSAESKKRPRSSSETSGESGGKKHKKKRSKSKKNKKQRRTKKHVSNSSDSSNSERDKKKHKKAKKKKKSKH